MQEWQRQKGSKGKGFGLLVCRRSASAVTSRGLHPGQFAARGRAGQVAPVAARFARAHREVSARARGLHPRQFAARGRAGQVAPVAARCRSCSSRGQRTSAGVAPQAIRGAWPRGTSRACGSSLRSCSSRGQRTSRGGCTPGNSRRVAARDKSRLWQLASLVLIERPAHVRGGCTPGNSRRVAARDKSRLGQLAVARAHREVSARPRGLHPGQLRACGSSLRSCSSRGQRTSAGGRCVVPPLLGCVTEKALFA